MEALAELGENGMNWTGARLMRDKAKAYLENAKNGISVSGLAKENEFLKGKLLILRIESRQLRQKTPKRDKILRITKFRSQKKRGRKPKIQGNKWREHLLS